MESIAAQIDRSWSVINGFIGHLDLSLFGFQFGATKTPRNFRFFHSNEDSGFGVWVSSRSVEKLIDR